MTRNIKIKIGQSQTCIADSTLSVLAEARASTPTVTRTLSTPYGDRDKEFYAIAISDREFLADSITGTLYDAATGRCFGSPDLKVIPVSNTP